MQHSVNSGLFHGKSLHIIESYLRLSRVYLLYVNLQDLLVAPALHSPEFQQSSICAAF